MLQRALNDGYKNQTAINHISEMHEEILARNPIELINLCESLIQLTGIGSTSVTALFAFVWLTLPLKKINKLLNTKIHSSMAINYF